MHYSVFAHNFKVKGGLESQHVLGFICAVKESDDVVKTILNENVFLEDATAVFLS